MISTFRVAESMGFKGELRHWEECCGLEMRTGGPAPSEETSQAVLRSTTGTEKHEAGDMTPDEEEEGGIWKWIGISRWLPELWGLICSIVAFITWCWSRRS